MALTVWKYELVIADSQKIMIPAWHKFLTVQMQNGSPCLWAMVDGSKPKVEREIITLCTGECLSEKRNYHSYIGTYQAHSGSFVGHVFCVGDISQSGERRWC